MYVISIISAGRNIVQQQLTVQQDLRRHDILLPYWVQGGEGTKALVKTTRREGKQRPRARVGGRWLPAARVVRRRTVGARDATRVVDVDRV